MLQRYRVFPARITRILALLPIVPVLAWADPKVDSAPDQNLESPEILEDWEGIAPEPDDPNEDPLTWVDDSHSYVTDQALELAQWMDDFFGDPEFDADRAESFLRLQFESDWDEEDGNNLRARLRGSVRLPKLSKRVSLVFVGEDGDELPDDERSAGDAVGVRVEVKETRRNRFDATLGFNSSGVRPPPGRDQ